MGRFFYATLLCAAFGTFGALTGCATNETKNPFSELDRAMVAGDERVDTVSPLAQNRDPFEEFNRTMFAINEGLDVFARPIARGYDTFVPLPLRVVIGNFFGNIGDVWISANNFLQGKVGDGFSDVGRVLINTTIGFCGIFDFASEMGLEKHSEDFGQTLAVWGVGSGPYFFWPLIGPRTARDTFGWAVDISLDPVRRVRDNATRNALVSTRLIEGRARLLQAEKVLENASFDKYEYIRDIYLRGREAAVKDED